jgi:hypothetical protein
MKPSPPRRPSPARVTTTLPTAAALLGTALALQGCLPEAHADPVPAPDAGVRAPRPRPQPQPQPQPDPPQDPYPIEGGIRHMSLRLPTR